VLVFEALQAARRDVVLDSRGGLVSLRFSRKPFSHTVSPSSANPVGPKGFQEMEMLRLFISLSRRFCSEIGQPLRRHGKSIVLARTSRKEPERSHKLWMTSGKQHLNLM